MTISLGTEISLAIHLDNALTYGDVESVLVDAGFTNYMIMRNVNGDGSADFQLYVQATQDSNGNPQTLPAAETLQKLSDAMDTLDGDVSAAGS